ncbi:MAG: hypothetical protein AAFQ74_07620 [Cyanobacteria bacterium J06623_4]
MLKSPLLFAIGVLVTLLQWTGIAKADTVGMGLSFDLPPASGVLSPATVKPSPTIEIASTLPLAATPVEVTDTTLNYQQEELPALSVEKDEVSTIQASISHTSPNDIALSFAENNIAMEVENTRPSNPAQSDEADLLSSTLEKLNFEPAQNYSDDISAADIDADKPALLFAESNLDYAPEGKSLAEATYDTLALDDWIFEDGTHSLVARTVGSAEGTRHWDGRRTRAYYGHVDPGNGVWNLGTFSYQHSARTPEEADEKQLQRLKRQGLELESKAAQHGLKLSLEEKLNGLDLANQAPLAALDRGGYIERLAQARRLQMQGDEAILWARTHSYIDPDTRRWNAPGLGNNINSISRDQERRMIAISKALVAFDPSGTSNASLAKLSNISLANMNAEDSNAHHDLIALDKNNDSAVSFSEMEVSFGLPPATPGLLDNLAPQVATSDEVGDVAASTADEPATVSETVAAPDIALAIEPTSAQVASQEDSPELDKQIAFGDMAVPEPTPSENANTEPPSDAQTATDSTGELSDSGEPVVGEQAIAPNNQADSQTELFSLRPADQPADSDEAASPSAIEASEPASLEATVSALTADLAESSSTKLQRLLEGIGTGAQPSEKVRTETETAEQSEAAQELDAAPKSERSLWRIEDKAGEF